MNKLLICLLVLISFDLFAVTYQISSPNFDSVHGAYSTDYNVVAEFETMNPLPENSGNVDFSAEVISYTFTDGVQILTEQNSQILFFNVAITNGQITGTGITIWRIPITTSNGGNVSGMDLYETQLSYVAQGFLDGVCINNSGPGGQCTSATLSLTNSGSYYYFDVIFNNGFDF